MSDHRLGRTTIALSDLSMVLAALSNRGQASTPAFSSLMVEACCWQIHWDDWYERRVGTRHPRFSEWITEGRGLLNQRDELKKLACELTQANRSTGNGHDTVG